MSRPNQLTILRMILTPIFVSTLFLENLYLRYASFSIFFIASLTDWYDGYVARRFGYVTQWGKFLDPLADKILISSAFVSLAILGYIKTWMVIVIFLRDFLITGLRTYAMLKGQPIVTSNLARWKTASQVVVVYFILTYMVVKDTLSHRGEQSVLIGKLHDIDCIGKLMLFVTLLTAATGIIYLIENRQHIKNMAVAFYRVFIPSDLR